MYTYLKDNPEADNEEEIAFTIEILDQNKNKYLLKHVLMDGFLANYGWIFAIDFCYRTSFYASFTKLWTRENVYATKN